MASSPVIELLPKLEPLFGMALAFNLAYLNLDKFRYLKIIATHADAMLTEKCGTHDVDQISKTPWYQDISSLTNGELAENTKSAWSLIYNWFFVRSMDFALSVAASILSAWYLIVGVALDTRIVTSYYGSVFEGTMIDEFFLGLLFSLLPFFLVLLGRYCISKSEKFLDYQIAGLQLNAAAEVEEEVKSGSAALKEQQEQPMKKRVRAFKKE